MSTEPKGPTGHQRDIRPASGVERLVADDLVLPAVELGAPRVVDRTADRLEVLLEHLPDDVRTIWGPGLELDIARLRGRAKKRTKRDAVLQVLDQLHAAGRDMTKITPAEVAVLASKASRERFPDGINIKTVERAWAERGLPRAKRGRKKTI